MRFVWAALLSGGFFAFVHVEPIRFFGLALMGVILAAVFEHRRALVASMARTRPSTSSPSSLCSRPADVEEPRS
jgi:hypothetical protein